MVRHVSKGGVLLGKWTPVIESIAMFPGKVFLFLEAILLKLILKLQIQDLKSLNIYNEKYFETYEDGYLLVSTYDQENGSFVLLYSLSENKEVFRWIPPLDIIHSMAPNYTQGINSFRYYRSQHPVLMNNGDIVFSSGEGPLVRLNKCNKIEWIIPGIFHHSNQKFDNEKYIYAVKNWRRMIKIN